MNRRLPNDVYLTCRKYDLEERLNSLLSQTDQTPENREEISYIIGELE